MKALVVLALFGAMRAHAQAAPDVPPGWQVVSPATDTGSARGRCANRSREEWRVTAGQDDSVRIAAKTQGPSAPAVLRVQGGKLVGVDRGEWGGRLQWVPDGGSPQEIYKGNIQAITSLGGRYYAFGGLAHMGTNEGEMLRVERDSRGAWRTARVVPLTAAPAAIAKLPGDSVMVVTSGALEVVHPSGTHRVAHRNPVWSYLYPNSVVAARSGVVYIGMRSAVARLTPGNAGFSEEWLVQTPC